METKQTNSKLEEAKKAREKYMATMKAQQEMLGDYAEYIQNSTTMDDDKKDEILGQVEKAQNENAQALYSQTGATMSDLENIQYRQPSEHYKKVYEERLKKQGKTDAQMRSKKDTNATVTTSTTTKNEIPRRPRNTSKEDLEKAMANLQAEDELMKATLATDEMIEAQKKKNEEFEKQLREGRINPIKNQQPKTTPKKQQEVKPKDNTATKQTKSVVEPIEVTEEPIPQVEEKPKTVKATKTNNVVKYDFDLSQIPDYVQYDIVPLPSKGECYPNTSPLRCGRVPVAYLTAADENIIASPNMYRDGKIIDVILSRKILDKNIDPSTLCSGDRDAIALWLRATGYGPEFPIVVSNPDNPDIKYNTTVDLSTIDFLPFNLKGDDDGHFEYTLTKANGKTDTITFKILTRHEQELLRKVSLGDLVESERARVKNSATLIQEIVNTLDDIDSTTRDNLNEDVAEILLWADGGDETNNGEEGYSKIVTENMIFCTVAINGNTDEEYIKGYIENMRSLDSYNYRNYLSENVPGMDFNITINIPESDGGGTINSFLRLDDALFLNVR